MEPIQPPVKAGSLPWRQAISSSAQGSFLMEVARYGLPSFRLEENPLNLIRREVQHLERVAHHGLTQAQQLPKTRVLN